MQLTRDSPNLAAIRQTTRASADPRASKTREKIVAAVHDLADSGFRSITVTDVLRAASVGKTAFYSHFSGLDELSLHVFLQSFGPENSASDAAPLTGEAIVARYAENIPLYATVVAVPLRAEIMNIAISRFADRLGKPRDIASDHGHATRMITAAGIIGAMNAWLRDEISVTEQDLIVWLNQLLAPSAGVTPS